MGYIVIIGYALFLTGAALRYFNVPHNIAANIQMWREMRRILRSKTVLILQGDYDPTSKAKKLKYSCVGCSKQDAIAVFKAAAVQLGQEEILLNEAKKILKDIP